MGSTNSKTISIEFILSLLEQVKPTGNNQWQALCPVHDDSVPSLSISCGDDGTILMRCHAGCKIKAICDALGIEIKDLFPGNTKKARTTKGRELAKYDYYDESGKLVHCTVRFAPKNFRQCRPGDNGERIWNLQGVTLVLYRLPELLKANPAEWIFIVEGEKDVDRLADLGLVATTCPMGAGKWKDGYKRYLKNRKVVILPDNDTPGLEHAKQVAKSILDVALEAKIVILPDLPKGGDVSDWLDGGGIRETLLELVEGAKSCKKKSRKQTHTEQTTKPPTEFNLTDAGNGERFAKQHGDKIRYCWTWNRWLCYDGKRWNLDKGAERANSLAVDTARSIIAEAREKEHEQRGQILKWSHTSESSTRIAAMLTCARAVKPIPAYFEQFDKDMWLLNCLNGTVDLRTGKLRPHNPADMITKLCPVKYDPNAQLELWDTFLATATRGDTTMLDFLQTAVGYSLTGDTSEEKLFFIHGPAASGKSTFLEAIKATFGDYALTSDFETFLERKQIGGVRNDVAKLNGARLVASIEVDEGKKLAEGLIKMLTGGDTVSARFLYRESFEFLPQFKLWLAANCAPRAKDDDDALWRRILKVPFEHVIEKKDQDPKVKATLRTSSEAGPAILAWAVKGCLKWQQEGLIVPEIIEQSTEEYRESQDPLKDFFEDECQFDPIAFVPVAELRKAYDDWAKDSGLRYTLGPNEFNRRLESKGCKRKSHRYRNDIGTEKVGKCWFGVTLQHKSQTIENAEN